MRIGVYVGSFNPPHEGHHKVIEYVLEKKLVDLVLLLPTPNYWDKNNLVDIEDRVKMLKVYEDKNVIVDTIHNGYSYTYEVLRSLKKDYPDDTLYLIIGSDNLERLHEWKNIEEILQNKVIVLKRGKVMKNHHLESFEQQFIYCNNDFLQISSTAIRQGNRSYLHPDVLKYIEENHLYEKL